MIILLSYWWDIQTFWYVISEEGLKVPAFWNVPHIWKAYRIFIFRSSFIIFFFLFIEPRVSCSMSMDFLYLYPVSELNSIEKTKAEF